MDVGSGQISVVQAVIYSGTLGLVAWLVRHTFMHTIPRLAKTYEQSLEKLHSYHSIQMQTLQDTFREELATQREACQQERSTERQAFREELREERKVIRELSESVHKNTEAIVALKEDMDNA